MITLIAQDQIKRWWKKPEAGAESFRKAATLQHTISGIKLDEVRS